MFKYDYSGTISGNGEKRFQLYRGFLAQGFGLYKDISHFELDKVFYEELIVPQDTGVYFIDTNPQQEHMSTITGKKEVTLIACVDMFSPTNKHRELAEALIPDTKCYFDHLDSTGASYYCWRVVP
jgi:hypothetical protein